MYELEYLSLCPFSRGIILILNELGIQYKGHEERDYGCIDFSYQTEGRKIFSDYPKLTIDTKLQLKGFYAISEYLAELSPQNKKSMFDNENSNQCRMKVDWIEKEMFQNILKIILYEKIFKNCDRTSKNRSPDSCLIRETESKLKKYLSHLQCVLETSEYIAGEKITFADFLLAGNLSVLDYFNHIIWDINLKRLRHWYSIIKSRTNFKQLLNLRIQGFQPSKQYALVDF